MEALNKALFSKMAGDTGAGGLNTLSNGGIHQLAPPKETVEHLYNSRRFSSRKIGEMYGVSKTEVLRWMRYYNLTRREPRGAATSRASIRPDKATLEQLLYVEFKTLEEIGTEFQMTKQAARQWLNRFGIPFRSYSQTRWKGKRDEIDRSTLNRLYHVEDYSLTTIGGMYGVGDAAIRRLCVEFDIPIKIAGWNRRRFTGTDGHSLRSLYEQRVCDWLTEHAVVHSCEPRLLLTHYHADFFARDYYIEVWGVTGNAIYSARKQRKLALYQAHQLPLIDISHSRFSRQTWQQPLQVLLAPNLLGAPVHELRERLPSQ